MVVAVFFLVGELQVVAQVGFLGEDLRGIVVPVLKQAEQEIRVGVCGVEGAGGGNSVLLLGESGILDAE